MTAGEALPSLAEAEVASWSHVLREEDVDGFAALSGDDNPLHMSGEFARTRGFRGRVVHGMLLAAYLSRVIGTLLPGPGVLWLDQSFRFRRAAYIGDRIDVTVRVKHRSEATRALVLDTTITNQHEETLMTGEGKVMQLGHQTDVPLSEMVAVVTGGSRGIGAAVAQALGERGASVIVGYHQRADAAEEVAEKITAAGGQARAVGADLEDGDSAVALADAALESYGRVDAVVNSASPPILRAGFEATAWEDVERYWRTYVRSSFLIAQRVVPQMKERNFGRFVNVLTSAMLGTPPADMSAYVTAKSGVWGLTKSMAVELAPFGITVNAVSPSAVITDQWAGESDTRRRALLLKVPAQRLASPEEVAASVLFLLGQEGSYLTGVNLPVAGGEVM